MTLEILPPDTLTPPALDGMDVREVDGFVLLETLDVRYRLEPDVALDLAAALIASATKTPGASVEAPPRPPRRPPAPPIPPRRPPDVVARGRGRATI